jgi:large subunit ribosomal protein L1
MPKLSKRMQAIRAQVDRTTQHNVIQAFEVLKKLSAVKFDESVDVSINLGIDARKSDQVVRGSTVLPKGTGRSVRVAVFAQGEKAEAAKAAGADIVGFEDLAETIKAGNIDFDVLIATPDAMRLVGQLGQILGPRGLMPNPKVGTVAADAASAVKNVKAGQARYRNDKNGIIHCSIGRASFAPADLTVNLEAVLNDLRKLKPSTAKGVFIKKITVSSTMGPGLVVDQASLTATA